MNEIDFKNDDSSHTFSVTPEFFDSLDDLQKKLNVTSREDVLQYALTLLYIVSKERNDSGTKLYISYPKGGYREIRFWNASKPTLVTINGDIIDKSE